MKTARIHAWALSLIALLLALTVAPALAHHKPGHDGGPGHKDGTTQPKDKKDKKDKDKNGDGDGDSTGKGKPKPPITDGAPGNNGTIKIDGEPFDTSHGEESHVGCTIRVLYFGFDEGLELSSTLTFVAHSPTSGDFEFVDTFGLGPDDPDIAGPYNLGAMLLASGIEPHPKQGWHVSLTTNTEYAQGADTKHKVFWVKCDEAEEEPAPVPTNTLDEGDVVKHEPTVLSTQETDPTVLGTQETSETAPAATEEVQEDGATLPFTGGDVLPFVLVALLLIAGGVALMRLRRSN